MTQAHRRCHLLIGPPGSGKTTLARDLALTTDVIRAELFLIKGQLPRAAA